MSSPYDAWLTSTKVQQHLNSKERVPEDGPKQETSNLINHIQQRKRGRGGDKRDPHKTSSPTYQSHTKEARDGGPASVYLIDHVGSVGGGQHRDVLELLNAVHLCQELSQYPVAYAAGARRAGREEKEHKTDEWMKNGA